MAYSNNPVTARKLLRELMPLVNRQNWTWYLSDEVRPDRFAYKIREALRIVHNHPDDFPDLHPVSTKYEISSGNGYVVARWMGPNAQTPYEKAVETINKVPPIPADTIITPSNITVLIQRYIDQQPSQAPINAREVEFTNKELNTLAKWARSVNWMVLHKAGTKELQLAPAVADGTQTPGFDRIYLFEAPENLL